MGKLALNDCLQTQVFRKIVEIYRANPILRRTIKPHGWFVWEGRPEDKQDPFVQGILPSIRLTPVAQPARPLTNVRFEAQFLIRQEIGISGLNVDDAMNLWYALHVSIFTGDGSKAALAALQKLSASATQPGQNVISVGLGTPAFTPMNGGSGAEMIVADGDIWVNLMLPR